MLDYGCDVQEAIDMPRGLHYEGVYQLEDSVPAEIVEGLKKLGHKTTSVVGPLGGGQAIWIDWDKGTLDRRFRSAQGRLRARILMADAFRLCPLFRWSWNRRRACDPESAHRPR